MDFSVIKIERQISVVCKKGNNLAKISCFYDDSCWHIMRLNVPSKMRRKRIGTKLLEMAIQEMIKYNNQNQVIAYTSSFNEENKQVKFYIKNGFLFNSEKGGYVKKLF